MPVHDNRQRAAAKWAIFDSQLTLLICWQWSWGLVSAHPMQRRLHVTTKVTAWKGLGLDVHRVLLAINVEELNLTIGSRLCVASMHSLT